MTYLLEGVMKENKVFQADPQQFSVTARGMDVLHGFPSAPFLAPPCLSVFTSGLRGIMSLANGCWSGEQEELQSVAQNGNNKQHFG